MVFTFLSVLLVSFTVFFYLDRWPISCRQLSILWSYLDITLLSSIFWLCCRELVSQLLPIVRRAFAGKLSRPRLLFASSLGRSALPSAARSRKRKKPRRARPRSVARPLLRNRHVLPSEGRQPARTRPRTRPRAALRAADPGGWSSMSMPDLTLSW